MIHIKSMSLGWLIVIAVMYCNSCLWLGKLGQIFLGLHRTRYKVDSLLPPAFYRIFAVRFANCNQKEKWSRTIWNQKTKSNRLIQICFKIFWSKKTISKEIKDLIWFSWFIWNIRRAGCREYLDKSRQNTQCLQDRVLVILDFHTQRVRRE